MTVGAAAFAAYLASVFIAPAASVGGKTAERASAPIPLRTDAREARVAFALAYVQPQDGGPSTPAPDTYMADGGGTLTLPRLLPPSRPRVAFDRLDVERARGRLKGQMIAPLIRVRF